MWDNTLMHARLTFGFTLNTYNFGVSVGHLSQQSGHLHYGREDLIVVDPLLLLEAFRDQSGFVLGFVRSRHILVSEHPFAR